MTPRAQSIFFEVFESIPRQGPGNLACTQRALGLCADLPPNPKILDLGCGAGTQTIHLSSLTEGTILAIDNHAPFIEQLRTKIETHGLSSRVEAQIADMSGLNIAPESLDLVWSEGALYKLGLDSAIPMCARLLHPGGYLTFTDAVWRHKAPPSDVQELFADYPTMGTVADICALIKAKGLKLIDHFDLPDEAWWDDFYHPMEQQLETLQVTYANDPEALAILSQIAEEPQLHRQNAHHYGYTFFVAQRVSRLTASDL